MRCIEMKKVLATLSRLLVPRAYARVDSIQARNQLGTPGGAKFTGRDPNFLNYVQHIFPGGEKFSRRASPPRLRVWLYCQGRTRLDGVRSKNQVWCPHVRTWGLSEAMCCIEETTWDFSAPGKLRPPRYAHACYSSLFSQSTAVWSAWPDGSAPSCNHEDNQDTANEAFQAVRSINNTKFGCCKCARKISLHKWLRGTAQLRASEGTFPGDSGRQSIGCSTPDTRCDAVEQWLEEFIQVMEQQPIFPHQVKIVADPDVACGGILLEDSSRSFHYFKCPRFSMTNVRYHTIVVIFCRTRKWLFSLVELLKSFKKSPV